MLDDDLVPMTPASFFAFAADCYECKAGTLGSKNTLPDLSSMCGDFSFANVSLGWSKEGIYSQVTVNQRFVQSSYPNIQNGDSVELFIDTRDVKTSGWNTRFCHHFFFLPEAVDEHIAGEITHFRTEDIHELCDPQALQVKAKFKKDSYVLNIFIPSLCLYGYDPAQFDRLGFSYRINRCGGGAQHFSVSSLEYQIDQQPSLWSSLTLRK